MLSLILDLAVRDGRLTRNPAASIRLPREKPRERRYLSHTGVRMLADVCAAPTAPVVARRTQRGDRRADYALVALMLAYTGLRFGELAAPRVRHLNSACVG